MLPIVEDPKRKRYLSNVPVISVRATDIKDQVQEAYSTLPDTTVDFAPGKIRISKVRSHASNNNLTDSNPDLHTLNLSN